MNSSKAAGSVNSKGNRLASLLDQLDKIWPIGRSGKPDERDFEQIRYVTNKIYQLLSSQEKCRKELMTKQAVGILRLLSTLRAISTCDMQGTLNVVSCFNELLTSGKRIGVLTDHDLPEVLFNTLIAVTCRDFPREASLVEELITLLHSVLSKMGTKEKRFSVQARMTGALQVSLNVAKQNSQNFKVLHPVLQVLKIYANSSVNCNIMIKGGAIETLLKIIPSCGQKRNSSAKLILEILAFLVKSKIGAKRAVLQGGVPLLLNMFVDWHRVDHRHRQTALRKAILNVLKLIVMINSGRKAMANVDGMKVLYQIGLEGLECKELDGIIKLIILILRRCFTIQKLPVRSVGSIFSNHFKSYESLQNETEISEDEAKNEGPSEDNSVAESDPDDLDIDEETIDRDEDTEMTERSNSESPEALPIRNDLDIYKTFLPELLEFTVDADAFAISEGSSNEEPDSPIRIPTAAMENSVNCHIPGENNHCFPLIRKSSSFDSSSLAPKPKAGIKSLTLSCDSENEAEVTTTSIICNSRNLKSQKWYESSRRQKIPSMPCMPVIHANNSDAIDFTVKGIKLQGNTSSPSLNEYAFRKTSISDDQIPELILQEEAVMPRTNSSSTCLEMISRLDRQQPCATGQVEVSDVKHVLPFIKKAAPDLHGHYPMMETEPLLEKKAWLHRHMIFQDFARYLNPDKILNRVVFDLHNLINDRSNHQNQTKKDPMINEFLMSPKRSKLLLNKSSESTTSLNEEMMKAQSLQFESRFESGNLRKAIQIRQFEYDLILNTDINTDRHCQWFYFEVSNMEADVPYRFNIINCEKFNSQFNFGMQPVIYSSKDAINGQPGWERTGSSICYYKNCYQRRPHAVAANRYYYTTTFTIKFPSANDTYYLAYHYPFTFSMMKDYLNKMEPRIRSDVFYQRQVLCQTSLGNQCEILTVTERPLKDDPDSIIAFRKRPYIILTSRVHPGESCASWIMKGLLDFLTGSDEVAVKLRSTFILKIVPFLNPDGVINGNHRCSISGDDLNRKWISPDPNQHPTIYHIKGLIQYLNTINKTPLVYCDFHGHSRKKNVFMYGCSLAATASAKMQGNADAMTFNSIDASEEDPIEAVNGVNDSLSSNVEEDTGFKTLPRILNAIAPAFSIQNCSFVMEKSKEATARIVVYKELGIARSYTVESTYCGADQGPYKGSQFGTRELEEMGKNFAIGLLKLSMSYSIKLHPEYFKEPCEKDNITEEDTHLSATKMSAMKLETQSNSPFVVVCDAGVPSAANTNNCPVEF